MKKNDCSLGYFYQIYKKYKYYKENEIFKNDFENKEQMCFNLAKEDIIFKINNSWRNIIVKSIFEIINFVLIYILLSIMINNIGSFSSKESFNYIKTFISLFIMFKIYDIIYEKIVKIFDIKAINFYKHFTYECFKSICEEYENEEEKLNNLVSNFKYSHKKLINKKRN